MSAVGPAMGAAVTHATWLAQLHSPNPKLKSVPSGQTSMSPSIFPALQ